MAGATGWSLPMVASSALGTLSSTAPWVENTSTRGWLDWLPRLMAGATGWLTSDGGVFSLRRCCLPGFDGWPALGTTPSLALAADSATGGYWEVATDGGIFSFDAPFFGSTGNIHLNQPINGHGSHAPTAYGYRFVASDGGVFDEGDAQFAGSMGGTHLERPHRRDGSDARWEGLLDGGLRRRHIQLQRSL